MNHPTFPDHTSLKTKLAVAAIGTGWVAFIAAACTLAVAWLFIARLFCPVKR